MQNSLVSHNIDIFIILDGLVLNFVAVNGCVRVQSNVKIAEGVLDFREA